MSRKLAREIAMKHIYQGEFDCEYHTDSMTEEEKKIVENKKYKTYIDTILSGVRENMGDLDKKIEENSKKSWKINRLPKVDLSILRISLYEIFYMDDIPVEVSINEAVELAKKYSTEESSKFINGLLGGTVRGENISND